MEPELIDSLVTVKSDLDGSNGATHGSNKKEESTTASEDGEPLDASTSLTHDMGIEQSDGTETSFVCLFSRASAYNLDEG